MESIDEIFNSLRNGEWHEFAAISGIHGMDQTKLEIIIKFLAKYHFIIIDKKHQTAKLPPEVKKFLQTLQQIEKNENKPNETK